MAPESKFAEFSFLHSLELNGVISYESFYMDKTYQDESLNFTKQMLLGVSLDYL